MTSKRHEDLVVGEEPRKAQRELEESLERFDRNVEKLEIRFRRYLVLWVVLIVGLDQALNFFIG